MIPMNSIKRWGTNKNGFNYVVVIDKYDCAITYFEPAWYIQKIIPFVAFPMLEWEVS